MARTALDEIFCDMCQVQVYSVVLLRCLLFSGREVFFGGGGTVQNKYVVYPDKSLEYSLAFFFLHGSRITQRYRDGLMVVF